MLGSGQRGRVVGGAARAPRATSPSSRGTGVRAATSCACSPIAAQSPYTSSKSLRRSAVRPVGVDRRRAGRCAAGVRDGERRVAGSGSCHGMPGRATALDARARRRSASAATCGRSRGSSHGSRPPDVLRVRGEPLAQREPGRRRSAAASSSMCGQGRSGLTWSGVSGMTPPQSSTPARSSSAELVGVGEVRRRLHPHPRAEQEARDGDRRRGSSVERQVVARGASRCRAWRGSSGRSPPARARARARRAGCASTDSHALARRLADADEDARW